jgi:hypothetical protein
MGLDETGTLTWLNVLRRDLIDPTIASHSGRIVKLMGDGTLVEFASAVHAVSCAIEFSGKFMNESFPPGTLPHRAVQQGKCAPCAKVPPPVSNELAVWSNYDGPH